MNDDLRRFLQAQSNSYDAALREIKQGQKRSHWMWYIFPILRGLGKSPTAQYYGLAGIDETRKYMDDPVLGSRLIEIASALLPHDGLSARDIFGSTDAWKLHCCMTLFHSISPEVTVFGAVLDKYFSGRLERHTTHLMETMK